MDFVRVRVLERCGSLGDDRFQVMGVMYLQRSLHHHSLTVDSFHK